MGWENVLKGVVEGKKGEVDVVDVNEESMSLNSEDADESGRICGTGLGAGRRDGGDGDEEEEDDAVYEDEAENEVDGFGAFGGILTLSCISDE